METDKEKECQNPVSGYVEATEGVSLQSPLKGGFDFLPKKDIMSIVMKRRLGGCESSCSENDSSLSPVKRPKISQERTLSDVNHSSVKSSGTVSETQKDTNFLGLALPNQYIVAGSVEGFNVSKSNYIDSDNEDSEEANNSFIVSDSKMDTNAEIDTGFKYTLEKQNLIEDDRYDFQEQSDDTVCDDNANTPNSKYFKSVEVQPQTNIDQNRTESQSSVEVLSENSKDLFNNPDLNDLKSQNEFSIEDVGERSEIPTKRSDMLHESSNNEITEETKATLENGNRESFNDNEIDQEFEIEARNELIQSTDLFRDKRDYNKNSAEQTHGENSTPNENELSGFRTKSSLEITASKNPVDEVDSLNANTVNLFNSKASGKKSRKQKMPMRLPTDEIKAEFNCSMKKDQLSKEQSDKPRNHSEPKRLNQEQNEYDYIDEDSDTYELEENFDTSSHLLEEWENPMKVNQNKACESLDESESECTENLRTTERYNDLVSINDNTGNISENELSNENETQKYNLPAGMPFNYQDTLLSYSKLFQPHLTNDLAIEKLLEQNQTNLTENLEVVKKLREIRFNRYRKITVSEKREIAEYAKQHSVSSAALHYGVSKSAVSMWTRIDFTDMDDSSGRRKKNCMIGNPKFEELIQRVRDEKANKFKNLSREDKVDVSRYAKLVGVREMSRCLNIALGTVSGWMRQFPYSMKPSNKEEGGSELSNLSDSFQDSNSVEKEIKTEDNSQIDSQQTDPRPLPVKIKTEPVDEDFNENGINEVETNKIKSGKSVKGKQIKIERTDEDSQQDVSNQNDMSVKETGDSNMNKKKIDEIDDLIAVTYEKPDVDKCFEDAKEMIRGSPLENDAFFEKLFRRVVECRADKYKSLKASEKLEVVRFAKRIGVRRIAKILGLATGTLSGWSTKYQAHLGLTSDVLTDMNQSGFSQPSDLDSSLDMSQNTSELDSQSGPFLVLPASSVLDNPERAEVTAVKLILKDRFDYLKGKIEVARKVKFKNITHDEKIEVVKCTKLAGIRPTARVLNMPIGTLSGWITKYTGDLPPVYQEECDRLDGQAIHKPTQSTYSTPGSQAYFFDLMNSQWPGLKHLPSLYSSSDINNTFENGNYNSNINMMNRVAVKSSYDNEISTENNEIKSENTDDLRFEHSVIENDMYTKLEDNAMYVVRKSNMDLFDSTGPSGYGRMQGGPFTNDSVQFSQSNNTNKKMSHNKHDSFEEEAKNMAAQYLKNFRL